MVLLAVANENNLDVELIETNPAHELSAEYLKLNPLKRVPTFVASDGWVLTEAIAIAIFFTVQNDQTTLLGKTQRDYAEILRWMSLVNSEIQPSLANWFKPLIGLRTYQEENLQRAKKLTNQAVNILETHLLTTGNPFLLDCGLTLADLFAVSSLSRGFQYVFDVRWRESFSNITKWYISVTHHPIWSAVVKEPPFVEEAVVRSYM